uniref:Uncharacterized protein n=1 Tax=Aegilops tauschii TaxID=37682 RepID=R7W115_AEGTA
MVRRNTYSFRGRRRRQSQGFFFTDLYDEKMMCRKTCSFRDRERPCPGNVRALKVIHEELKEVLGSVDLRGLPP